MLWSKDHPKTVILIVLLISALACLHLDNLRIDTSAKVLMVQGDPARAYYQDTIDKFGADSMAFVFVRDPRLFTPAKLALLEQLAYDLEDVPGVLRVESLFTVGRIKYENGMLNSGSLIEDVPQTQAQADAIKKDALANEILRGKILSKDGESTTITLYLKTDSKDPNFTTNLARAIEPIVKPYEGKFQQVFQIGSPYNVMTQVDHLTRDQETLIPLSALIVLLMLAASMGSISGAVLPIITASFSVLWTLGFMAFLDIPFTVLTFIVPSLIIVIGSTEDMHIISHYLDGAAETKDRSLAVDIMIKKVATATALTAVTTFLGFLSIAVNDVTALRQFGFTAGFGLFVNPLITVMLSPIYLRYVGPLPKKPVGEKRVDRWLATLAGVFIGLINRRRRLLLAVGIMAGLAGGILGMKVVVDNDAWGMFRDDSDIIMRVNTMNQHMCGVGMFFIRISSNEPNAFLKPRNLAYVEALQTYLRKQAWFDNCTSLTDYLKLINREMHEGDPAYYKLPSSEKTAAEYLLFLRRDEIASYVTGDYQHINIVVRHQIHSSRELNQVLAKLRAHIKQSFPPEMKVGVTGEGILVNQAVDSIAAGQVESLLLILLVIFVLMAILFVNIKAGFLSLIPNLIPICLNFGVMYLLDIKLNSGTCMVAAVAVGIAVDDTVHIMTTYYKHMRKAQDQKAGMEQTIRGEVRPVLCTSLALGLGFWIIGYSDFVPIAHFGMLSALVMVFAVAADLLITPSLLVSTQLITLWDMLALRLRNEVLRGAGLFDGLKKWQVKKIVLLCRQGRAAAGELLVRQGDMGRTMFILMEGSAKVVARDQKTGKAREVAELGPGDIFGEIALVSPGPRTADVIAASEVAYLELDWKSLNRIRPLYPRITARLFLNIARILGKRLGETNRLAVAGIQDGQPGPAPAPGSAPGA